MHVANASQLLLKVVTAKQFLQLPEGVHSKLSQKKKKL